MRFETLDQFINSSLINRMKWLREAEVEVEDLAIVMVKHPEFANVVKKSVGAQGRESLSKAKILDYKTSLNKLTQIEFKPVKNN